MIKRAIIVTLILNSFIIIAVPAGHGYGIMAMFEVISIPSLLRNGLEFKKDYPFESSLLLIGLVSFIGKLMLITSLFFKKILDKKNLIYAGLILIMVSFIAVIRGAWEYDIFILAIITSSGIPFIMYFGRVIYLMNKENRIRELSTD